MEALGPLLGGHAERTGNLVGFFCVIEPVLYLDFELAGRGVADDCVGVAPIRAGSSGRLRGRNDLLFSVASHRRPRDLRTMGRDSCAVAFRAVFVVGANATFVFYCAGNSGFLLCISAVSPGY